MTSTSRLYEGPGFSTMSIAAILAETAHRRPDAPALHFMGHTIPYGPLWDQTRAYAGALRERGIGPGDRVAVVIPNVPDFVRVYYAVLSLGAVVVPVHLLFKADEIEYVLRDSGAKLAVVAAPVLEEAAVACARAGVPLTTVLLPEAMATEKGIPRLEVEAQGATPIERYVSISPLDAATILYTSGTTGAPKGAIGTHLNMIEQVNGETSPTVSFNYVGRTPRPGTVGQPNWGVDVEIADPENEDEIVLLPHGELGEIVVRGYNLFAGYLGRPEATAEAFTDGWFRTGDLGTKDDDDYITIVDRKKDMIVRNGYNVYPNEVEQVLLRHPGVVNAAVFGVADDTHGQEIHAAVIPHDDTVAAEELIEFVKERIAAYKYPRVVHLVPELPLGPSGKVLKRELVARFQTAPAT